jgi:hypothetical protein
VSWRTISVLGALLLGLVFAERQLLDSSADQRLAGTELAPLVRPGVGRLIDAGGNAAQVAGFTLTAGIRGALFFARTGGLWRAVNHFGAPASEDVLVSVLGDLFDARGVVETRLDSSSEGDLRPFGLDSLQRLRLELHGTQAMQDPQRDVLFTVDLGHRLEGGRGTFARVVEGPGSGPATILSIDSDLRGVLEARSAPELPPLVDAHLIAGSWPGFDSGLGELEFESPSTFYQLVFDPPIAADRPGSWRTVVPGRGSSEAAGELAIGYVIFLSQAQALRVRDPRNLTQEDVEQPDSRVIVNGNGGESVELLLVRRAPDAAPDAPRTVLSSWGGTAFEVEPEIARLLFPGSEVFEQVYAGATPWDAYLPR